MLKDLAARDPHVRVVGLSRNFGHQVAITAGIDLRARRRRRRHRRRPAGPARGHRRDAREVARGLQGRLRRARGKRKGESAFKRLSAKVFYRVLGRMSETPIPLDTGDFRLMDRQVVDVLKDMREENRYVRGHGGVDRLPADRAAVRARRAFRGRDALPPAPDDGSRGQRHPELQPQAARALDASRAVHDADRVPRGRLRHRQQAAASRDRRRRVAERADRRAVHGRRAAALRRRARRLPRPGVLRDEAPAAVRRGRGRRRSAVPGPAGSAE